MTTTSSTTNTALISGSSLQVTLASLKKIIPVGRISQHKPRLSVSAAISSAIWRRIKPVEDAGDIQSASTNSKVQ